MNSIDDLIEFFDERFSYWKNSMKVGKSKVYQAASLAYQDALERAKELKTNMEKNNVSI